MPLQSAPVVHSVYFYETEEALIQRLVGIATSALNTGNAALMVVTLEHAEQLAQLLSPRLFRNMQDMTRLTVVDADATLQRFMVNGMPDRELFLKAITALVDEASIPAEHTDGSLTVFGEMVAVLWGRGQKEAALELERLWNEALASGRFFLHCAYPKSHFMYETDQSAFISICEQHSHTFGTLDAAM
jgi:hypothetical protein